MGNPAFHPLALASVASKFFVDKTHNKHIVGQTFCIAVYQSAGFVRYTIPELRVRICSACNLILHTFYTWTSIKPPCLTMHLRKFFVWQKGNVLCTIFYMLYLFWLHMQPDQLIFSTNTKKSNSSNVLRNIYVQVQYLCVVAISMCRCRWVTKYNEYGRARTTFQLIPPIRNACFMVYRRKIHRNSHNSAQFRSYEPFVEHRLSWGVGSKLPFSIT